MSNRKDKLVSEMFGEESVLTPSELADHDLPAQAFGGYKRSEVDALLNRAADALEALAEKARALREEHDSLVERLEEHRQMESALRDALVSSQKFGEEIIDASRREAEAILREARAKRSEEQLEAGKLPEKLAKEIQELEEQRNRLRRDMMNIIETHRRLLDEPGRPTGDESRQGELEHPEILLEDHSNGSGGEPTNAGEGSDEGDLFPNERKAE